MSLPRLAQELRLPAAADCHLTSPSHPITRRLLQQLGAVQCRSLNRQPVGPGTAGEGTGLGSVRSVAVAFAEELWLEGVVVFAMELPEDIRAQLQKLQVGLGSHSVALH